MKSMLSRAWLTGLAFITAAGIALVSVNIERIGPEQVQYGNLCGAPRFDPCYKPALKGGFPIAFLFDAPGVSRERQLAFGEDSLHVGALLANTGVYFTILVAAWALLRRRSAFEATARCAGTAR